MSSPNIPGEIESPLSPVLSSSKNTKFVMRRKLKDKSRIKLSDKFSETETGLEPKQKNDEILDSYCLGQEINIWEDIDKIEAVEAQKKVANPENFSFKIPISPAPSSKNKTFLASPDRLGSPKSSISTLQNQNKKEIGFQTCSGIKIQVPSKVLGKSSKIFDDILNSNQQNNTKLKKFNFLKKNEPGGIHVRYKGLNLSNVTESCKDNKEDLTFSQQIDDLGISNTQLISVMDTVLDKHSKILTNKNYTTLQFEEQFKGFTKDEMQLSNSYVEEFMKINKELLDKVDITSNKKVGFKRLNKSSNDTEPCLKKTKFDNVIDSKTPDYYIDKNMNGSNKELHLTSLEKKIGNLKEGILEFNKEFKNCEASPGFSMVPEEKLNILKEIVPKPKDSFSGFLKASGKKVGISKEGWSKSRKLFEDIDREEENRIYNKKNNAQNLISKNSEGNYFSKSFDHTVVDSKMTEKILTKSLKIESDFSNSFQENFTGFLKASGKNIIISKDAWSKSIQFFENIDHEEENTTFDKSINNIDFNSLNKMNQSQGFLKASGSLISISEKSLIKAKNLEDEIQIDAGQNYFTKYPSKSSVDEFSKSCFDSVSGLKSQSKQLFGNIDKEEFDKTIRKDDSNKENIKSATQNFQGFSASGSPISISKTELLKVQNLFTTLESEMKNDLEENILSKNVSNSSSDNTAVGLKTPRRDITLKPEVVVDFSNSSLGSFGFSKASGKKINISKEAWSKCKLFENIDREEELNETKNKSNGSDKNINFDEFSKASGSLISISDTGLLEAKNLFTDAQSEIKKDSEEIYFFRSLSDSSLDTTAVEFKTPKRNNEFNSSNLSSGKRKRSLGITTCKQIDIPEQKLTKAKLMFNELPPKSTEKQNNPTLSNRIVSSTPLPERFVKKPSSLMVDNEFMKAKAIFGDEDFSDIFGEKNTTMVIKKENYLNVFNSTPIKSQMMQSKTNISDIANVSIDTIVNSEESSIRRGNVTVINNYGIVLKEPENVNIDSWLNNLQSDRKSLEQALKNVIEKQNALNKIRLEKDISKRRQFGTMSVAKKGVDCVSLRNFVMSKKPGAEANFNEDYKLFDINPQNAASVHFISKKLIKTTDGATLLPNSSDLIGFAEIEIAFQAMPGVDPKLIPKSWIANHYKWIIWKLASYKRMFPVEFKEVFCLEQVIQQLKYRYDREIDKAERSALRKIYEKDDSSQKRLVLCVSNITEDKGKYELELTDGWYAIKTVVDDPLSFQVFKRKIQVGTKLITSGAEVYNCDGCYPLETTNIVYMKINFNCTRRAAWYSKLGYQPCPSPFPIQLHTIHQSGGVIGCLKVYIARSYPLKYMERENAIIVWRNKKAEERRAQEWEMERNKKVELIQESARKEFTTNRNNENRVRYCKKDISEVTCPISLNEIYESSIDPDRIQELFSLSQRETLMDYQRSQARDKQDKINVKVKDLISKSNLNKRDISSVWKLLIIDVNSDSEKTYSLNIWRPTHVHQQILQEGKVATLYNVLPGKSGELSSSFKTKLNLNPEFSLTAYNKFNRKLVPISLLFNENEAPIFNEFDTIGVIVDIKFETNFQSIWLADDVNTLLLVKIHEPAKYCILLDNLKRGQIISCCNLCYKQPESGVAQATGNHYSLFSRYSQYKHLQEAVTELENKISENMDNYLVECDKIISNFSTIHNLKSQSTFMSSSNISDDSKLEESTLDFSRVTDTDVAMSMIDIDKLLKQ
ncbi:unnamed protein product [Brassicogethes aeneus]|uniref:Uncharacterized protein n=1 Tax=Brassicogethes aeneus TaxID=1431903 RepID=A0A9P0FCJ8_BRAAE|nr:unnamed protein product [Brassicogethes aeneus]